MSDLVRVVLYFAGLIVALLFWIHWLLPWLDDHVDEQIMDRAAAVIGLIFLWGITWLLYLLWSSEYGLDEWAHNAWIATFGYALAAMWIGIMIVVHLGALRIIVFGLPHREVTQSPVQEPEGPAVAAFGVVVLLLSLVYVFILVKDRDSFWAERFLNFRVFALWFLCGIYLLLSSKVLDPVLGAAFGDSLVKFLSPLTGDHPEYSLLVGILAIVLASVVTLWYEYRKQT
jgi:hypothetical protein